MAVTPLAIKGQQVKTEDPIKFLGTTITNILKWDIDAETIATAHVLAVPTQEV